jgi:hypothetical protein
MDILPDQNLAAVVITNTRTGNATVSNLSAEILKTAMHMERGLPYIAKTEKRHEKVELTDAQMDFYCGDYATPMGLITIKRNGRRFFTSISGKKLDFIPLEDGWFKIKYKFLGFIPISSSQLDNRYYTVKQIGDEIVLLIKSNGNVIIFGKKIKPAAISGAWENRLGEYAIENNYPEDTGANLAPAPVLSVKQGYLHFSFDGGKHEMILLPVSDTEAIVAGLGRGYGQTVYVRQYEGRECLDVEGWVLLKNYSDFGNE